MSRAESRVARVRKPPRAALLWAAALLLVVACVAALTYLRKDRLSRWLKARIEAELGLAVGGEVRIGRLDLHLLRLQADLTHLDLSIPAEGTAPLTASIESGRVRLAWQGLGSLAAGRIHLREVVLVRPMIVVGQAFLEARRGGGQGRPEVRIDHFELSQGTLIYENQGIPLDLQSEDVELRAGWDRARGSLAGEAGFSMSVTQGLFRRPLPVHVRSGFRFARNRLDVFALRARAPGLDLELDGHALLVPGGPTLAGEGRIEADLESLAGWLREDLPALGGRVQGPLRVDRGPGPLRLFGRLAARNARLGPLTAVEAAAAAEYRPGEIRLRALEATAYGGKIRGVVDVALEPPVRFQTELDGTGLDVESLLELVGKELPFESRARMSLRLEGEAGRPATWDGTGQLFAEPGPPRPGRIAVGGAAEFSFVEGRLSAHSPDARLASTSLDARMDLDFHSTPAQGVLKLAGTTSSATEAKAAVDLLLQASDIALPDLLREPISGTGAVRASIELGGPPALDLSLHLRDGAWANQAFLEGEVDLALRGERLDLRKIAVTAPEGALEGSGRLALHPLRVEELDLRVRDMNVDPMLDRFAPALDLRGRISGWLGVRGSPQGVSGSGKLTLVNGSFVGEEVDEADATIEVRGSSLVLSGVSLRGPAGDALGSVRADLADTWVEFTVERATLGVPLLSALRSRGIQVEGEVVVSGSLRKDSLGLGGELRLEGTGWRLYGVDLGDVAGRLDFEHEGIRIDLSPNEDSSWHLVAQVGWSEERPFDASLDMDQAMLRIPHGSSGPTIWSLLSGRIHVQGALARPEELRGEGVITRAQVHLGPVTAQTVGAVPVTFAAERMEVGPFRLEGRNSGLDGTVLYRFSDGGIEARGSGQLDLNTIAAFWPGLRATGQAAFDLQVAGTIREPQWNGSVTVHEGRIRTQAFPEPLEKIDLALRIENREATVRRFSARLGGGEVRGEGRFALSGLGVADYSFDFSLADVRLAYPAGFKGVYEGRGVLEGDAQSSLLKGRFHLVRGLYTRDFAVGQVFGSPGRPYDSSTSFGRPALRLDLDVEADGGVWVQNDLARVEAEVDLHIAGELNRPEVTGRIGALEGGTLHLRDVDYRVVSCSLDFFELDRINPYVDLRAETRVKGYDIFLHVEGTLDKFDYQLTSSPSLSTQDIIALLATGDTLQGSSTAPSEGGTSQVGDQAANYFAGALTGRFERSLERVLGLERVRIDPLLLHEQADPTARVTVGKRVSKNVFLIYSTNLGSTERQLYQMEWEATRKFRLLAERDTTGGIGGEIVYSTRVNPGAATEPEISASEPSKDRQSRRVAAVAIEGAAPEEERKLLRDVPLKRGSPFRRSAVYEGADVIRRFYVRSGRLEARLEPEVTPRKEDAEQVQVTYRVSPGPRVRVEIEGLRRKERRRLESRLQAWWLDSVYTEDLYEDATDVLRHAVGDLGYYTAELEKEISDRDGIRIVRFRVEPGKPVEVDSVRIEGTSQLSAEKVRRQILTRPSSPLSRRLLRPDVLEQDRVAIQSLYLEEGFLQARVPPPKVRLSTEADSAEVTFTIEEGPLFTVAALEAPERPPFSSAQIAEWSGLRVGQPFSSSGLVRAETYIRSRLDAQGYPEARVTSRTELLGSGVKVRFEVDPGERKKVGSVSISGNQRTRDKIIRRGILLAPGDPLSREKMLESQHQLYRLGILRNVHMDYAPMGGEDPSLQVLRVRVEESPPVSISLGAGYDTEGGPRGSFSVVHDNVGGFGRGLAFQGRASGIERRLQVLAKEPRLFNRDLQGLLTVFWENLEQVGFTEDRRSTAFRVEKRLKPGWTGYVRYNFQRVDLSDIEDALAVREQKLENLRLGDVSYAIVRSTRDDPFLPTRGGYASAEIRLFASPFLSDSSFAKLFLQGSTTHTFPGESAVAAAVRIGTSKPFAGTTRVPLSERFFAGGESTLRGFPRDAVGPNVDGFPEGGEAVFLLNGEWRFPIRGPLKGVLFYDGGNVYEKLTDLDPTDLRHVLGAGLRLETPIGPIRLEYGRKLDQKSGESAGELFLAIGAAF